VLARSPCEVIDFDRALAMRAGLMRRATRAQGLSLGDRACLALAERLALPVLTADRVWADLDLGIEVVLIR
jgi:ribonuclease VapC